MDDDELKKDDIYDDTYLPRVGGRIAHYYGDYIRRMFLGVAVVLLVSAPFLTGVFSPLAPLHIIFAPVLIGLSALTNPRNQMVMIANAAVGTVGAVIFELIALALFRQEHVWVTVCYEALALAFVFALYFSLKTVRAMHFGVIGKRDLPGEFMEKKYEEAKAKETR